MILDHEIMFKNQVQELHRLHEVQKLLVKDDSKYERMELFPVKSTFTEYQWVEPSRFTFDQDFGSRFQQRPLDLRLSTGISCDDDVFDCEELSLTLSIGMTSNKRIKTSRTFLKNRVVYPSPAQVLIDLEDSKETGSNEFLHTALHQGSNGCHDVKQTVLLDLDLNKVQPDDPYSQPATSLTFKSQPKTCAIDLESLPEPSSDLTEEKESSISESSKQNENKETNYAVENAALSLISISKQLTSTVNQDSNTKPNENKKKTTTRSLSVDSYESLVLKLEESSIEEHSATSKTYEMNEFDQKGNRIKLKRGRRLKDFRKDVLPTLSSLSKHEIWEDIKLLEGVIRSREYKRLNKAKTGKKCSSQKRK